MSTMEKVPKPDSRSKYSDCLAGKGGVWGGICLERGVKGGMQMDSMIAIHKYFVQRRN